MNGKSRTLDEVTGSPVSISDTAAAPPASRSAVKSTSGSIHAACGERHISVDAHRCPARGCPFPAGSPDHTGDAVVGQKKFIDKFWNANPDRLIRQRPHDAGRGGGYTSRCHCGHWVTPGTVRQHYLCGGAQ